ncbi:hypothetical protein [Granulicoccus phenolivorans]|uniref:hypothetical protein n=1 Tax=Granulicoccus phenolivorans TaxID=266854 RepID=UPI00068786F2|nr:hypothetical protein [Granulicoccus phenolivorans]
MRTAIKTLAIIVVALVAVQASMHAWGSAGLEQYLAAGGVVDFNSPTPLPVVEYTGLIIHGMNGMYVIPLVVLVLTIVSLISRIRGAAPRAFILLGLVVLQVTFGLLGHVITVFALLHGINAILIATTAVITARWASKPGTQATAQAPQRTAAHV